MSKIDMKRPTIWYQEGDVSSEDSNIVREVLYGQRLRVISPDGSSEWICLYSEAEHENWDICCWNVAYSNHQKAKNHSEAILLMKKFDKSKGFPKAVFVGYA